MCIFVPTVIGIVSNVFSAVSSMSAYFVICCFPIVNTVRTLTVFKPYRACTIKHLTYAVRKARIGPALCSLGFSSVIQEELEGL